nr:MAG TPA: hypothetical protein [Crassvirales sp.]
MVLVAQVRLELAVLQELVEVILMIVFTKT